MCKEWLKFLPQVAEVEVVGLVDVIEDNARARAQEAGLSGIFIGKDLAHALKSTTPDAVFDISLPETHVDVTLAALEQGCHVLGEKPMADSMENAAKMLGAAKKAGKIYCVIQNRRYDARIRRLRKFLDTGAIGSLTTLYSNFFVGAHFGGFRDRMKHVLVLDMAIHTFDAARFILGADPVAVYCKDWNPEGSWYDHDASAVAVFEMTSGIVYTYCGSWCCEGLNASWEADWRIIGSKGTVTWDGADHFRGQRAVATKGFHSDLEELDVPGNTVADKEGGHIGIVREFVRCVRTGETPETTCTDNIKSLAMVFGAIESSETGRRVEIRV
jgi:predicted dehydrogenase